LDQPTSWKIKVMEHFTIFGNPVEHSKSPQMHNAGFSHIQFDGVYDKTKLEDGSTIKQVFLEKHLKGANITVPHKIDAFNNADEIIGLANKIGAVNTYIKENNTVKAYNTDAPGFMKAIEEFQNIKPIKTVLLLGAGGTSKAIAVALRDAHIDVTILNRSMNNKEFFIDIGCKFYDWDTMRLLFSGGGFILSYDLIVNSTSAGLKDEQYPVSAELLKPLMEHSHFAFDCIYGKLTPFLQIAKDYGIEYKDGEDMLLYQGVIAFELFTSTKATTKVIEAMRRGLKSS